MEDAENVLPLSKKRAAGRELTKDSAGLDDEEDAPGQETGTFKRASEEVLSTRRIVRVRRNQTTSAPSSNPFAGINLVPPTESNATSTVTSVAQAADVKTGSDDVDGKDEEIEQPESKIDGAEIESSADKENAVEKENINIGIEAAGPDEQPAKKNSENEEKKDIESETVNSGVEGAPLSSFQQLSSSKNAFTGLAGTGISTSTFSFGSISTDGSTLGTASVSLFGVKDDKPFGLGLSTNGSSSIFGTLGATTVSRSEGTGFPSMQEVAIETGEEHEEVVFTADSVLFEFVDGGWKERGKGELKVNVSTTGTERARVLMRARGNYRLILNASLYPDSSGWKSGDWYCTIGNCGTHNFASRSSCFKCGASKDESSGGGYYDDKLRTRGFGGFGSGSSTGSSSRSGWKSGDWICSRMGCNEHNFASRMECFRCNAPRDSSAGRSPYSS